MIGVLMTISTARTITTILAIRANGSCKGITSMR